MVHGPSKEQLDIAELGSECVAGRGEALRTGSVSSQHTRPLFLKREDLSEFSLELAASGPVREIDRTSSRRGLLEIRHQPLQDVQLREPDTIMSCDSSRRRSSHAARCQLHLQDLRHGRQSIQATERRHCICSSHRIGRRMSGDGCHLDNVSHREDALNSTIGNQLEQSALDRHELDMLRRIRKIREVTTVQVNNQRRQISLSLQGIAWARDHMSCGSTDASFNRFVEGLSFACRPSHARGDCPTRCVNTRDSAEGFA